MNSTMYFSGFAYYCALLISCPVERVNKQWLYNALQVSCLAGVVNEQLSMSLYKLIAFVLCTIIELSHCLSTLSSG